MVVHGAVDGYSRLPVYLSCSDNNRAATVLELFKKAVYEFGYGLPARIRCDKGIENYDVAMFMLTHPQRESTANPVLVGKSVHNQRIERLWRDVYSAVICTYYSLFYQLEDMSLLDPSNSIDLLCLHLVFIPQINYHLEMWRQTWINHKMSSCNGQTPLQLWIQGWQHMRGTDHVIAQEMFADGEVWF